MEKKDDEAPLTEPKIVLCIFLTGAEVDVGSHVVQIVGWAKMLPIGGETEERRIVTRFAMPIDEARALATEIQERLKFKGH